KIVEESDSMFISPDYMSATLKVKYQSKRSKMSFNANLRLEKDKKIWVNVSFLGISFARGIITPEGMSMYERQNKTTFTGDFKYLSNLLGVELDFYQLQSLLLGKPILEVETNKYKSSIAKNSYLLEYENNKKLTRKAKNNGDYIKRYWYNPVNFELERQLISQPDRKMTLMVDNDNYELVGGKYQIPEKINLQIIDDSVTLVAIEYKGIKVDRKLSFPFRIPANYKELKLK
ncbi:MAG: DUF4292 domain-containing protein, partial [Flavobacteriales bacterium]|nr:DUF4292 domain-containing protein [Flavobacteriales bacterium]